MCSEVEMVWMPRELVLTPAVLVLMPALLTLALMVFLLIDVW